MTKDKALKLALEALESGVKTQNGRLDWIEYDSELVEQTITAIKEALAQPEQTPYITMPPSTPMWTIPLQRTWVGLTDEEIEVTEALKAPPVHPDFVNCDDWMEFARAIEAKLKEKNDG